MGAIRNQEGDPIAYYHDQTKSYTEEQLSHLAERAGKIAKEFEHPLDDKGMPPAKEPFSASSRRYPSTSKELNSYAQRFFGECIDISDAKNKRYAGAYDPFKNFRMGETYGIAIRMTDKVSRLLTLLHPTNTTDDNGESIEDTCKDLANYAMLLSAMRANERGK